MSIAVRIKDCIDNHDRYIALMATMSDKELAKKLDLVHLQMELAEKKRNTGSLELLEVWHHQIIEARIYKAENEIPDQPSEIDLAIADIEVFVARSEERKEAFDNIALDSTIERKTRQESENNDQLSLF